MNINVRQNAKRNILFGLINRSVLLLLPFLTKSTINQCLGSDYLGLNSLFSSILQVLLLSEMGLSSALVYHMYKPIAENDTKSMNALLNLYRKAYFVIGLIILVAGLAVTPFLPYLIKGSYPEDVNLALVYVIQVVNTSISYFLFGYRQSLLSAYQREDVNSIINLIVQSSLQITQIVLLYTTESYIFYILCMPIATVMNNIWIWVATRRMFPDLKSRGRVSKDTLSDIKKLVAGTFIQKACATTRNSLDSICISSFMGLTLTGIYNNYFSVMSGVTVLLAITGSSLSGGIGNHVATKSVDDNYGELKRLDFLYMGLSGWMTVCLLCLFQPFMHFWMGEEMMLPLPAVILFCLYFYVLKIGDMRSLYSTANGLWWKMRHRAIVETLCNVLLNVALGMKFGVCGIISATIISLLFCNLLWGASILFSSYFGKRRLGDYFVYHLKYFVFTAAVCFAAYFLCSFISMDILIVELLVKGIVCTLLYALCFLLTYGHSRIFREAVEML